MRLFVAEKPSLAKEIAKGLGKPVQKDGYYQIGDDIVTWAYGHILRQLDPNEYDEKYKKWCMEDLPIVPAVWKLTVSDDCKKQFKIIKDLIGKASVIVNAGDPDREGQLLIDEILDYVKNTKPVKRILLNALDEKSVRQALNDIRNNEDFIGLKNSALARQRADWLIGMNLSRAFTLAARAAGFSSALSIGRVKTPTMSLVVRRENEIKNFKPVDFYQVQVDWLYGNRVISSVWQPNQDRVSLDEENRLLDQTIAVSLLQKIKTVADYKNAVLVKKEEEEKKEAQCLTYSLSALQVAAGKKFGYEPQMVLDAMQELYEKKLTTYPRSDCSYLPENQTTDAPQILKNLSQLNSSFEKYVQNANLSIRSRVWNDKKISAHHAIIPTTIQADLAVLSEIQQNLYKMVAVSYISQFYPVHKYRATTLYVECSDELFRSTGKTIIENGWKALFGKKESTQEEKELPCIEQGELVKFSDGRVVDKVTTPPKRFTSATLLRAMKEVHKYVKNSDLKTLLKSVSGIGTEATRAKIIDDLQKKGFLVSDKKNLLPTKTAEMIFSILPGEITYPDTTALWEEQLERIVQGEISIAEFFEEQKKSIFFIVDMAKKMRIPTAEGSIKCPLCKNPLIRRVWKGQAFWACSSYPNCKVSFSDIDNKPFIFLCPTCKKGFLRKIQGNKGLFWSCTRYPDCKTIYGDRQGKPHLT